MNTTEKIEVIRRMAASGSSWKEISASIGCSDPYTRYLANKSGIKKVTIRRKWSDDQMMSALSSSNSISEALKKVGLKVKAGNYDTVREFIRKNKISIGHMRPFSGSSSTSRKRAIPISEILKEGVFYSRSSLKKRIIRDGLLENKCSICGILDWNGKELKLVLDHVNWINNDNRIENLRLLCPNCNSQQDTFCRGNRSSNLLKNGENLVDRTKFCSCGNKIFHRSTICQTCSGANQRKVERPSMEQLSVDIKNMPMTHVGKKYGVSDNAVRKWVKSYGI